MMRSISAIGLLFFIIVGDAFAGDEPLCQTQTWQNEKECRTPAQQKMDSHLVVALKIKRRQLEISPEYNVGVEFETDGRVRVDISARVSEDLLGRIRQGGGEVISSSVDGNAIYALVRLEQIEVLAGLDDVNFIGPFLKPMTN